MQNRMVLPFKIAAMTNFWIIACGLYCNSLRKPDVSAEEREHLRRLFFIATFITVAYITVELLIERTRNKLNTLQIVQPQAIQNNKKNITINKDKNKNNNKNKDIEERSNKPRKTHSIFSKIGKFVSALVHDVVAVCRKKPLKYNQAIYNKLLRDEERESLQRKINEEQKNTGETRVTRNRAAQLPKASSTVVIFRPLVVINVTEKKEVKAPESIKIEEIQEIEEIEKIEENKHASKDENIVAQNPAESVSDVEKNQLKELESKLAEAKAEISRCELEIETLKKSQLSVVMYNNPKTEIEYKRAEYLQQKITNIKLASANMATMYNQLMNIVDPLYQQRRDKRYCLSVDEFLQRESTALINALKENDYTPPAFDPNRCAVLPTRMC